MTTSQELVQNLQTAAQDTPYVITASEKGFQMTINIVDAKWYTLLYKNGLKKTFTIDATLNEVKQTATTTDTLYALDWQAGADAGSFVPRIGGKLNVQKGEVWSYQAGKQYGISEKGQVGETASWKFSSIEAKEWLDSQLKANGWHRSLGGTAKGALVFAIVVLVLMAILFPLAFFLKK
jgi:hypothetical protein